MFDWLASMIPGRAEDWWIISVGAMTNVACALLGCYLVLRKLSLLGDALSHAVLPGLVLAFILTGSVHIGTMFAGAFAVGLLTTFLTQSLQRIGGISGDSAMGVVFTSLFALGVVLLRKYTHGGVDLDADCVLYGQLEYVPNYQTQIFGVWLPRAAVSIGPVLCVNVLFIVLLWKELKLSAFDEALATTMGFRAGLLHYLLMALVAGTAVGSFEAVGSILVIAMLIVPGATAHLLTDRLGWMLVIAASVGVVSAYLGWLCSSLATNVSTAGMMTVIAGLCYLSAFLFSPRYGIVGNWYRNLVVSSRIVREDFLAMLFRVEELSPDRLLSPPEARQALGGGWQVWWTVGNVLRSHLAERVPGGLRLSGAGRDVARRLVRSHRLWEAYLFEQLGLPLDHVHVPAARMEHYIGDQLQARIEAGLTSSQRDPHGREIPGVRPDEATNLKTSQEPRMNADERG